MGEVTLSKRCPKCKQIKLVSEFYKDHTRRDGLRCYCKNCHNSDVEVYQQSEKGKGVVYAYQRSKVGREVQHRAHRKYLQTDNGKEIQCRCTRKYRLQNPEITKAHKAVHKLIKVGRLTSPGDFKCRDCNEQAEEYHHYLGYAPEHWLDVIALCKDCHRQNHQQLRRHF